VLISEMNEERLRALGLQLTQGTAQLRRRRRWRVLGKDDRWAGCGAASHLVLDELVNVLEAEVCETSPACEKVGELLGSRARLATWRLLINTVA